MFLSFGTGTDRHGFLEINCWSCDAVCGRTVDANKERGPPPTHYNIGVITFVVVRRQECLSRRNNLVRENLTPSIVVKLLVRLLLLSRKICRRRGEERL